MFSSKHAKFYAFITKVNNSPLFWPLAARLPISSQEIPLISKRNVPRPLVAGPEPQRLIPL